MYLRTLLGEAISSSSDVKIISCFQLKLKNRLQLREQLRNLTEFPFKNLFVVCVRRAKSKRKHCSPKFSAKVGFYLIKHHKSLFVLLLTGFPCLPKIYRRRKTCEVFIKISLCSFVLSLRNNKTLVKKLQCKNNFSF